MLLKLFHLLFERLHSLTLPEEEEPRFVGVWGQRHLQYLKEYRRNVYLDLMMSGRLNSYLADIEEQAQERFERIVEQMKQTQGITEQLKADNALEWVGRMNNIQACTREIVDKEIIISKNNVDEGKAENGLLSTLQ